MKNKLLLILLVGCLAGIVLAGGSSINKDFVEQNKIEKASTAKGFSYSNLNSLSDMSFSSFTSSLNDLCDGQPPLPPPGPNPTPVDPPCVDLSDNEDDNPPFGNTQKDLFEISESYVARYYEEVPTDSGNFVYYDQRLVNVNNVGIEPNESTKPGEDGKGFEIQIPNPYQPTDNYGYYKVEVVKLGANETIIATVGVEVHYPNFQISLPF